METNSMDHGASGKAKTKRGPSPTPGAVPHKDKRWAQAVATSAPANTGKRQRLQREVAVPRGVGPEAEAEASVCAVQLVAKEAGVATAEVECDHRALEARSERPVRTAAVSILF